MRKLFAAAVLLSVGCATGPEPVPEAASAPAPAPAPAPVAPAVPVDPAPVVDGDVTVAWFHGMEILVKRVPTAEFVAGHLFIRGGVRNWGVQDQGVEQLALAVAAHGGTQSMDKDAFNGRLASMGSAIEAGAGNDFSGFNAKSLKGSWEPTFAMLADAFLHPALPKGEVELQRARQISALKHEQESPDGQLRLIVHQTLFKGHPYEYRSVGTFETVKSFTAEQLAAHLAKLRETRRLLLVLVGDVDAAHVLTQVQSAFGGVPRGAYQDTPLPLVKFDKARLVPVERKLPTNYIEGVYLGPKDGQPDSAAAMVAGQVLDWRVFEEVRTKRNLSYAPHAGFSTGSELPRGYLYVTATKPNETVKAMYDEVHRLQSEPVPAKELEGDKSVFLTGYFVGNETTDSQAQMLGAAQLYWGDWKVARRFPEMIKAVTADEVQKFAHKYIGNLQTVVIGSPDQIDPGLVNSL